MKLTSVLAISSWRGVSQVSLRERSYRGCPELNWFFYCTMHPESETDYWEVCSFSRNQNRVLNSDCMCHTFWVLLSLRHYWQDTFFKVFLISRSNIQIESLPVEIDRCTFFDLLDRLNNSFPDTYFAVRTTLSFFPLPPLGRLLFSHETGKNENYQINLKLDPECRPRRL